MANFEMRFTQNGTCMAALLRCDLLKMVGYQKSVLQPFNVKFHLHSPGVTVR